MKTVVKETATHRLCYKLDEYPHEPYNDGSFPILRKEKFCPVEQPDITAYEIPNGLVRAFEDASKKVFERYARMFYGTTTFTYYYSDNCEYVTFDTEEWRASLGIEKDTVLVADMTEYAAWIEGDCYYFTLEEKCSHGDWHVVDSVGGFYGEPTADTINDVATDYLLVS